MYSCLHHTGLQVVRESSNLLKCEKIFADNLAAIDENNEILLQTGVVDTTDEHPPIRTAIIHIDDKEVFLIFERSGMKNAEISEVYKGGGYKLTLTYEQGSSKYGRTIYNGKFLVEGTASVIEHEVAGRDCNL